MITTDTGNGSPSVQPLTALYDSWRSYARFFHVPWFGLLFCKHLRSTVARGKANRTVYRVRRSAASVEQGTRRPIHPAVATQYSDLTTIDTCRALLSRFACKRVDCTIDSKSYVRATGSRPVGGAVGGRTCGIGRGPCEKCQKKHHGNKFLHRVCGRTVEKDCLCLAVDSEQKARRKVQFGMEIPVSFNYYFSETLGVAKLNGNLFSSLLYNPLCSVRTLPRTVL